MAFGVRFLSALVSLATVTNACAYEIGDPIAIIDKMSAAHGGSQNWLEAPAVRLRYVMHLLSLKPDENRNWSDSWRYYETTIDPDTSRTFTDVIAENRDGYEAGFDGKKLWRTEYSFDPSFQDGPLMLSWYHYGMVALPFISKAKGAQFEYLGQEELPSHPTPHHVVRINYEPSGWAGEMTLYIDTKTNLLRGWKQGAMFPPLPGSPLPGIQLPPASPLRVVDQYQKVGGFILPRAYVSYNPAMEPGAFHYILEAEILPRFNEQNAAAPKDAQISFEKQ